jgi:hypothetical protein
MDLDKIFIPLLVFIVFGVAAIILIETLRRRRRRQPTIILSLLECPDCGTHNPRARERCYCCGFGFILAPSDGTESTVIQRVRQADNGKTKGTVGTQTVKVTEPSTSNHF